MRQKYIFILFNTAFFLLFATCQKEPDNPVGNNKVVLSTISVDSVSYFFANVSAEIVNAKKNNIIDHGFCYSTSSNPDVNGEKMSLGKRTDDGTFNADITGLNDYKKYYIRAYASFAGGTLYAGQKEITTLKTGKPLISTSALSNITLTTAICGGEIESDSGYAVTASGICWDTDNEFNEIQSLGKAINTSGNSMYSLNITGLIDGTTYYVKAFATNQKGTGYGEIREFSSATITLPTVSTNSITNPTANSATGGGNVTSDGNANVTAKGVCWSTNQYPTLNDNFSVSGTGTGAFVSSITGLSPTTTYYVRAYATNSLGTAYGNQVSFTTTGIINCNAFTLTHSAGGVAPVNKTVNYGVTLTDLSGETKCWITQNLGADHQPTSATDATEASAGWYWQFNRKQGYKHDGTNRIPNTTWISSINENSDWLPANDPCSLLLGSDWRLPTGTEWQSADFSGSWDNFNQTFSSILKLHAAGNLYGENGFLAGIGSSGFFWGSSQNGSEIGQNLHINASYSGTSYEFYKTPGFSIRCLNDGTTSVSPLPSVITAGISNITPNSAICGGEVTFGGGATVTARGICWSTGQNPTLSNDHTTDGSGMGAFVSNLSGLSPSKTYYVRAYAINSVGTAYGNQVSFTTTSAGFVCGNTLTINHIASEVAPVNKTVNYGTVETNLTGSNKCWITQNLGADRQAISATDDTEASAGWYWQFNRKQGYKHDGSILTPSTTWLYSIDENSDWLPSNDPCTYLLSNDWRIPTKTEWESADANGGWSNYYDTFQSVLKLHSAGGLSGSNGSLYFRGTYGNYWSTTQMSVTGCHYFYFNIDNSKMGTNIKWNGFAIRCLRN